MLQGNDQCHSDDECPHPLRCCGGMVGSNPSTYMEHLSFGLLQCKNRILLFISIEVTECILNGK